MLFARSWLADLCHHDHIPFVLRHALYPQAHHRPRSGPGVGKVLALILLYEIHDIGRFSEAVCIILREREQDRMWLARREQKHGKARAAAALPQAAGQRSA